MMYKCSKSTLADTGTWALHMTRSFPTTSGPHGLRVQQPHGTESAALSVSIPFPCSPVEAQIEVPMTSGKARFAGAAAFGFRRPAALRGLGLALGRLQCLILEHLKVYSSPALG